MFPIVSQVAFHARDYAEAIRHGRHLTVIDPEFWIGYMQLGQAYKQVGEADRALDALITASKLSDSNSKPLSLRGYILAKCGDETRRGNSSTRWRPCRATATCRVRPSRSFMPGSAIARRCSSGSRKPERHVQLIFRPVPINPHRGIHTTLSRALQKSDTP